MKYSFNRLFETAFLGLALAMLAACGDSGKWVEAPDALYMYQQFGKAKAMMEANSLAEPEPTTCEDHLEKAREDIEKASPTNIIVKQMVRTCGNAGLQFGREVRCEAGRLQVKCK